MFRNLLTAALTIVAITTGVNTSADANQSSGAADPKCLVGVSISGTSMSRYVANGDRIVLSKCRSPGRDDLVVFRHHEELPSLKRIAAVAGDVVDERLGVLHVNGEPVISLDGETELSMWRPGDGSKATSLAKTAFKRKLEGVVPEGKIVVVGDPDKYGTTASPAFYGHVDLKDVIASGAPEKVAARQVAQAP